MIGSGSRRRRTSPRWRGAPRAGSPRSSWRLCRCRAATTRPGSSPASRATTGTSSTTSSRRSSTASRRTSAASCSRPPCSTGSAAHSATPSPAAATARRCSSRSSARTCSSSRSTTSRRWYRYHHLFADVLRAHLLEEQPERGRRSCTGGRPSGTRGRRAGAAPSGTRWPPGTSSRAADLVELLVIGAAAASGRRRTVRRWMDDAPGRASSGAGRCSADRLHRGADVQRRLRAASRAAGRCRAAAGADPTGRPGGGGRGRARAGCPARSQTYRAALALVPATRPARSPTPTGRSLAPRPVTTSPSRPRRRCRGWRPGAAGTSRRRTAATRSPSRACERAGNISDVLGCSITLADLRDHPGPARRRAAHLRGRAPARRRPRGRRALRGTADMLRRAEPARTASATTSRRPRELPGARRGAGRAPRAAAEPLPVAGRAAPGCARPRATWTARSTLLEEAERVYVGDFSPNVRPVAASGRGCWSRRAGSTRPSAGRASSTSRPTTTCATSASTSTSPWPGSCCASRTTPGGARDGVGLLDRLARGRRGGRADRHPDRDPGAAGARPAEHGGDVPARSCRWSAHCAGRARGLRARLRRRGAADGGPARGRSRERGPDWAYPRRLLERASAGTRAGQAASSRAWSTR